MNDELREHFKKIRVENIVFAIFIILILLAYYANNKEVDYFLNKNETSKKEYYYLQIIIFLIVVIINLYYIVSNYNEVKELNDNVSYKRRKYAYLDLIASLASLVAGLILLYVAITDTEIEAEISL